MNDFHLQMLASPAWAQMLEQDLMPWIDAVTDLGDDLLEVGPGPGLSTDLLRRRAARVTAIESDSSLAAALRLRLAGTNVEVIHGDAATSSFADNRFSGAACFGVLHHVESPERQDQLLAEVLRVLRPGTSLVVEDGYDDERTRARHTDDTFVPLDLDALPARLEAIGYVGLELDRADYDIRFCARKPA
jgi:SAM-dependent methyltransferase